ncbi:hypothetical protein CISIN_1g034466mg [Citrus sinensis]|uniref:Uncharacterized protein n=1 Tax=Citrus sinensis TaxID=2711 RepID=A0A067DGE0_CITSI|nr:hypothetical protein CISIN_1g034466mg [Citrus sinensis]
MSFPLSLSTLPSLYTFIMGERSMAISAAGSVESMGREKVQKNIDGLCLVCRRRRKDNGAKKYVEMKTRFVQTRLVPIQDHLWNLHRRFPVDILK